MSGEYTQQGTVDGVYDVLELGRGLVKTGAKKVDFNHARATLILEDVEEFAGDRPLRQNHVNALVKHMQRGTFHPEWVHVIVCIYAGKKYRMNGQHCAWARLEMDEDWPCAVTWETWEAKTKEDMRQLYCSIDRSAPRTKGNIVNSYLVDTPEFGSYKRKTLQLMPQGFSFWKWEKAADRQLYDGDEVAYLLKTEHLILAQHVANFLDTLTAGDHKHLLRSPTAAAVFATMSKTPSKALEFWQAVSDGVGFTGRDDSRKRLRDYTMIMAIGAGAGAASIKHKVSQEGMYRACLFAWRAWRAGRTMKIIKFSDRGPRPVVSK